MPAICTLLAWRTAVCIAVTRAADVGSAPPLDALLAAALPVGALLAAARDHDRRAAGNADCHNLRTHAHNRLDPPMAVYDAATRCTRNAHATVAAPPCALP